MAARDIARIVGAGLGLPVVSLSADQLPAHFGWFAMFVSFDMPASSALTRKLLGWEPKGPTLLTDLANMDYAAA